MTDVQKSSTISFSVPRHRVNLSDSELAFLIRRLDDLRNEIHDCKLGEGRSCDCVALNSMFAKLKARNLAYDRVVMELEKQNAMTEYVYRTGWKDASKKQRKYMIGVAVIAGLALLLNIALIITMLISSV